MGRLCWLADMGSRICEASARLTPILISGLASVSKQFTAMAVMLLVHDGKLRYDERLTDIFPDFPVYGRGITVRHLLNHTSGLQDYEDLMSPDNGASPEKIPQIKDAGVLALLKQQTT